MQEHVMLPTLQTTTLLSELQNETVSIAVSPLVSVIIPCYNHGKFLANAINSVLTQTYKNVEIVVVNDGSKDNTEEIVKNFPGIVYVYQENKGLSAARNTGINNSKGEFLVFLDADDWLQQEALAINVLHLQENREAAFVSGAYIKAEKNGEEEEVKKVIDGDHYNHMLEGNYVEMIATVMFRRFVFEEFRYDESLKACEDYDLFLTITRKYPVLHHQQIIAYYYYHDNNMSYNTPMMLRSVLEVMKRHKPEVRTNRETKSFQQGVDMWKTYYCLEIYSKLLSKSPQQFLVSFADFSTLLRYKPDLFIKLFIERMRNLLRKVYRRFFPVKSKNNGPVNFGELYRTTPLSTEFGYDRGGPVDRYYIENFLEQNRQFIKGRVLEIGDNDYTIRFGGSQVQQSDILHVDASNPQATYVGDLSNIPELPDNLFDCIVLTQTLHLIYNTHDALATCYRVLKKGGALLLTVPGISHIDQGEWKNIWLWSFTESSVKKMLSEVFAAGNIRTTTHGNVLVATAFLYGMGLPEIGKKEMDETDPHYQVIITAVATK